MTAAHAEDSPAREPDPHWRRWLLWGIPGYGVCIEPDFAQFRSTIALAEAEKGLAFERRVAELGERGLALLAKKVEQQPSD
ncbi:hypothetical protein [Nonomuraea sp. bgisy101]|uniref:hypothetical protein n=1 Tax=Nonomuraea sp. bgisy101 TaxID=3413784 RepID=UPI003D74644D